MLYDLADNAMGCILSLFVVAVVGGMAMCSADVVQSRRAFNATTACEKVRDVPRRKFLGTEVVCIPQNLRQDTTTVRLDVKDSR